MIKVVIESPFAGAVSRNIVYAKRAVLDCLARGEAPIASHLLFTQQGILRDAVLKERLIAINAGHAWIEVCDYVVLYQDYGVSPGMLKGMSIALEYNKSVAFRNIGRNDGDV